MKNYYTKKRASNDSKFFIVLESQIYNAMEDGKLYSPEEIIQLVRTKVKFKNFCNILEDMSNRGFLSKKTKA